MAIDQLPPHLRRKARVIYQSVAPSHQASNRRQEIIVTSPDFPRSRRTFDVCVIGHLRQVKDPFRAALAARLLPSSSRIRVLHVGGSMNEAMAVRARAEMEVNPRYHWLGEQPRWRTRRILRRSQL
jgi:hypothetical protein